MKTANIHVFSNFPFIEGVSEAEYGSSLSFIIKLLLWI